VSLLSNRRLGATLFADRVAWALSAGVRARIAANGERSTGSPSAGDWRGAVDALAATLREQAGRGVELDVVLSARLAHCLVLPWPAEVEDDEEGAVYASHQFRHVFGEAADGWEVRFDAQARGRHRLACGIDRALLAALREAAKTTGVRLASIRPLLVSVFNDWRRAVGPQPTLFFVAEPGRYCGAWLERGEWQALRHGRLDSEATQELADALTRETTLLAPAAGRLFLYAPHYGDFGERQIPGLRRIGPVRRH